MSPRSAQPIRSLSRRLPHRRNSATQGNANLLAIAFTVLAMALASTAPAISPGDSTKSNASAKDVKERSGASAPSARKGPSREGSVSGVRPEGRSGDTKGIVIEPPSPSGLSVQIWTDRSRHPVYAPGEDVRIYFRATRSCYLYVFNTDTRGVERQIFPNHFDRDNRLHSGRTYYVPDRSYRMVVTGPSGRETLRAVVVAHQHRFLSPYGQYGPSDPFPRRGARKLLEQLEKSEPTLKAPSKSTSDPRRRGSSGLQGKGIVIEPDAPSYDYASATTYFWVRQGAVHWPPPVEPVGRLRIDSSPQGAKVYLDRVYRGVTPITVTGIPFGVHDLYVEKRGYIAESRMVSVEGTGTGLARFILRRDVPWLRKEGSIDGGSKEAPTTRKELNPAPKPLRERGSTRKE